MADIQTVKLDQIPEIKRQTDELKTTRDQLVARLVNGVATFEEYVALAGEIRGISRAIRAPYIIRD